jgi:hypothetical protein
MDAILVWGLIAGCPFRAACIPVSTPVNAAQKILLIQYLTSAVGRI